MNASSQSLDKAIAQAIAQSGGSAKAAKLLLMQRARIDANFLQSLATPHIGGIISYHIDRILRKAEDMSMEKRQTVKGKASLPPKNIPQKEFANDLRKAIQVENGEIFGQEFITNAGLKRVKASKRHVDAIKAIAAGGEL